MVNKYRLPLLYFDGQMIDVLWDNIDNCVEWFEEQFDWKVIRKEDWKVDPRCEAGKMHQLDYGTWIITYKANTKLPHHFADRENVDGNVRLCFRVNNLESIHQAYGKKGIKVSSIYDGPKTKYFDIWATSEDIRLTLQEDPSVLDTQILPSWIRVGVASLQDSIKWYQHYMGMSIVEYDNENQYAIMSLKMNHSEGESLWVIEQNPNISSTAKVSNQVQPYCWIHNREEFFEYHQYLISEGIDTSEIGGFITQGMVNFHFYDLDGNRFNVSSM